ncbi:hypothetical protein Syun_023382 [Stephania yunnanensis]|uniref:Uncharacterized protein n=1 Tax=Stephania yunnanensis TaxID=152371 RepID=A0AAP0I3B3_9MAGN
MRISKKMRVSSLAFSDPPRLALFGVAFCGALGSLLTFAWSQQQQQPPHNPTFYGIAPPPEMSPLTTYLSSQLGYMHEYMTYTLTAIDTRLEHQGDRLRRIKGHLLPAKPA